MAIYFMNGKTFLNEYVKEDPQKVMRTQFVIVSSTIRKGGKYEKQVINGNNILYPSQELIMDYENYKHNQDYKEAYFEQLEEGDPFLSTLIKYAIEEGYTIVFLCGKRETKYHYLKLIQEYVDEKFHYHIYDYKKIKDGKEKEKDYDSSEVLRIANKILKKAKKKSKEKMLSTDSGRKKVISDMSNKQLKKELKKRDLYFDGMSRSEMMDTMDTFL